MNDPRYASGTSLARTKKEEHLDSFERAMGAEFSDRTYLALKGLPLEAVRELHAALADRVLAASGQNEAGK
jgi:hypothetical protein